MASWTVVPNLDEGKAQLDKRFPNRDKASDGSIGDTRHQASASSHNPDKSGSPEWRDGDSKNEVRARDFDADLRDPNVKAEQVVQLWVKLAREGKMWWIRYIIFNKRIWHKRDGFKTRAYTGTNKHTNHFHVNSDFTQKADDAKRTNWYLSLLPSKAAAPKPPAPSGKLKEDGVLGPKTITKWQQVMGTKADGKISENSSLVRAVQTKLKKTVDHRLVVDGDGNSLDVNVFRKTIAALQRYLKTPVDGKISTPRSQVILALQRRLNENKF